MSAKKKNIHLNLLDNKKDHIKKQAASSDQRDEFDEKQLNSLWLEYAKIIEKKGNETNLNIQSTMVTK